MVHGLYRDTEMQVKAMLEENPSGAILAHSMGLGKDGQI